MERGRHFLKVSRRAWLRLRLRNLLIHRYWEIDDERVYMSVKLGLRDSEEFMRRMRGLVEVGNSIG